MARRKLSDEDRKTIRALHNAGASRKSLALKYNVSYNTIKRVLDPQYYAKHMENVVQYNKDNRQQIYFQKRATFRTYYFSLNREHDATIISKLDAQENVTDYIRYLVSRDLSQD